MAKKKAKHKQERIRCWYCGGVSCAKCLSAEAVSATVRVMGRHAGYVEITLKDANFRRSDGRVLCNTCKKQLLSEAGQTVRL